MYYILHVPQCLYMHTHICCFKYVIVYTAKLIKTKVFFK